MEEISTKPKVAICLAAFNGENWIQEQIDSILCQEGVDVTIFVSVDLSSDRTKERVDSISLRDKRVIVLKYGQKFGGAAPNFIRLIKEIDFSQYDYVGLADQDDIWHPQKIHRAISVLGEASADGYSSNVIAFWPDGRELLVDKSQAQRRWDFLFEAAGPGCTYVIKSKIAMEFQTLLRTTPINTEEIGLHDWALYAFVRARGYQWVIDKWPGMLYRQHSNNQIGVNLGLNAFLYRAKQVLNGWGFNQAMLIARFIGIDDNPFVRIWFPYSRIGFFKLAFYSRRCRRRIRDQFLFAAFCFLFAIVGFHRQ